MQNQEAFLYIWHDRKLDMDYLGYHKGYPEDGYVCTHLKPVDGSPWMLEEYKERPEDFSRTILAYGVAKECRKWEEIILTHFDAARSPEWYNKHNGGEDFVCKRHSEETKRKISRTLTRENKGKIHYNKGRILTAETKQKMSCSHTGKKLSQYHIQRLKENHVGHTGHFHSEKTREQMKLSHIGKHDGILNSFYGKKHTIESRQKMSVKLAGENNPMYGKHRTVWNKGLKGIKCKKDLLK